MTPEHPWMWHWGGMWIFPMFMFILMIIIFFVFFARGRCRPFGPGSCRSAWWCPEGDRKEDEKTNSALEILKSRYAKGEITKDEFEQMKKDILS
jgi:putative membrane protein